jgi:formimidoylglutamate deiminase
MDTGMNGTPREHDAPARPNQALLWAPRAWIDGAWHERVLMEIGADRCWASLQPGQPPPPTACRLPGPVLPGLVDAHSHAFQRAFAGLAEHKQGPDDDFWTWRDRMYGVALSITPDDLRRWATRLYGELLRGGYTQVCEFHYLHHDPDGRPYADPLAMSTALIDAAQATGIGLTLLPVLYERAGFFQPELRADQRRFATDVERVIALRDGVRRLGLARVQAGVAIHSLRAAAPASIERLLGALEGDDAPIHIHVAEQTGEVDDCLKATGRRPIDWLCTQLPLDARWQLVHATHALPAEIEAVARRGAGVVICPSTEANLGDGLPDLPRWLASGVPLSVGSDSQVTRAWPEELRWLEYGQRLHHRRRNLAADPAAHGGSSAARLFQRCLLGGAQAAGFARWGFVRGARADLLLLDDSDSTWAELPPGAALDALVFSSPAPAFAGVMVAGAWALRPPASGARAPAGTGP